MCRANALHMSFFSAFFVLADAGVSPARLKAWGEAVVDPNLLYSLFVQADEVSDHIRDLLRS